MQSVEVANRAGTALQSMLRRLRSLAGGLVVLTTIVGVATFLTGWWIFQRSHATWSVLGGTLCLLPVLAAVAARLLVGASAKRAPALVTDLREFFDTGVKSARVLVDYDTGQPIGSYVKSFGSLRADLNARRKDLPSLFAAVRAVTSVPGLAAIAVGGLVLVGGVGTVLLIGGLID